MNGTPGFPIDLCGQHFHRSSSKLLISDFLKPVLAHCLFLYFANQGKYYSAKTELQGNTLLCYSIRAAIGRYELRADLLPHEQAINC